MATTNKQQHLTVERSPINGMWIVSALLSDGMGAYLATARYAGYTKQQAIARYLEQYGNLITEDTY